jgi:hypothetical protein
MPGASGRIGPYGLSSALLKRADEKKQATHANGQPVSVSQMKEGEHEQLNSLLHRYLPD